MDLDKERARTVLIMQLLLERKQAKQIAYIAGCSQSHIHQVKWRYFRERIILVLLPEGRSLLDSQQLSLPFPKARKKYPRVKARILRSLGR